MDFFISGTIGLFYRTSISIRRFSALPSSVSFEATGCVSPRPSAFNLSGAIPLSINALITDTARPSDSFRLYSSEPLESVCPTIVILTLGFSLRNLACLSSSLFDSAVSDVSFVLK